MIHLHLHTHYSALDGFLTVPQLVSAVKKLGMSAVAVTEHGNINSWIEFQIECTKQGIKPIFGIEAYVTTDESNKTNYHITLLAKNNEGLREIIKLHNTAHLNEQKYRAHRIYYDQILECSNIIVLSGCLNSYINRMALADQKEKCKEWIYKFQNHFGSDFYIEIQDLNIEELDIARERILKWFPNVQTVITNDVHYENRSDADSQHTLYCAHIHKKEDEFKKHPPEMYIKTDIEGYDTSSTYEIADKCNASIEPFTNTIPNFTEVTWIPERIIDKQQCRKEYTVIKKAGYWPYLCIVADYVKWAKEHNIMVGYSRGSAGGSLLAYAMGIHDIDPIKYDLYFSRFFNEGRIDSMPDIDTDFPKNGIAQVKDYIKSKYHLVGLGTYGTMDVKNAIKMVCRTTGVPPNEANELTKRYGDGLDVDYNLLPENHAKALKLSDQYKGLLNAYGQHASGYILSHINLEEEVPVRYSRTGDLQTCWNMDHMEWLGFVKFDLLKLTTLDIIHETLENIGIQRDDIPIDDKPTYDLISTGKTFGLFQISGSDGIANLCKQIQPKNIEDIGIIISLYRPGPMENNFHTQYIDRKNGAPVEYLHPFLEPLLQDTYGVMIYQEQVIKVCMAVGFSDTEADTIRKIMGKKKPELLTDVEPQFIEKCSKITGEKIAKILWEQLTKYSHYNFNKAHAIGYAYLAYITAYLKCHYPLQFYTAILNQETKLVAIQECINDIQGFKILPPRYGKSEYNFKVEGSNIRYGIKALYGIGEKEMERINDPNFFKQGSVVAEQLIKAGFYDTISTNRKSLISQQKRRNPELLLIEPSDFTKQEKEQFEFDLLRVYLDKNPLSRLVKESVYTGNNYQIGNRIPVIIQKVENKTSKKGNKFAKIHTININNKTDTFFLWGKSYEKFILKEGCYYIITLDKTEDTFYITNVQELK